MTWVQTMPESEEMDHVLASHSLNWEALDTHLALYRTIMFGASGLSRAERERSRCACRRRTTATIE